MISPFIGGINFVKLDFLFKPYKITAEQMRVRPSFLVCVLVFFALAYLLKVSAFRWGDLIIDTAREAWVPKGIVDGRVLYKDISYNYGIFAPYFIALLFKIFGVNLNVLAGCGLVVTTLMSFFLYRISRLFVDEIISALTVFTFLFVFAFGQYSYTGIFNFIIPYSFASTFSVFFTAAALYFFCKYFFTSSRKHLLSWAIFLIFVILTRPEFGLVVWLGFVSILLYGYFVLHRRKGDPLLFLMPFGALLLAILLYVGFFIKTGSFAYFKTMVLDMIVLTKTNIFVINNAGLNAPLGNTWLVIKIFISHMIVVATIAAGSYLIKKSLVNINPNSGYLAFCGVFIISLVFINNRDWAFSFSQYEALPVVLILGIAWIIFVGRHGERPEEGLALLSVFVVSLICILKILLAANPNIYGFYLIPIALAAYYIFFFRIMKDFFLKVWFDFPVVLFSAILTCFFIFQAFSFWAISRSVYQYKAFLVSTDKGNFSSFFDSRSVYFWETVAYLSENTSPHDTVVVLPEGIGVNFFSDRDNPLPFVVYQPTVIQVVGEKNIISQFISKKVDYCIILHRPTGEQGADRFGIDYGKELNTWIVANYKMVKLFGKYPYTSSEFGAAIFKRKS